MSNNQITLEELSKDLQRKISTQEEGSYSYELAKGGVEKITRKIGEEATEVIIAAFMNEKNPTDITKEELVGEVCDLIFHNMVLLAERKIDFSEILAEMTRRNNQKK